MPRRGWVSRSEKLIVGSNANHVLDGFFRRGRLELGQVVPTISPSMDIQVPSNLERLMFDMYGGDGGRLREAMIRLRRERSVGVPRGSDSEVFVSRWYDDRETARVMADVHRSTGRIVDPHTAVGIAAARDAGVERTDRLPRHRPSRQVSRERSNRPSDGHHRSPAA